ncbi:MAG: hypothetical protein AAF403_08140, partial [Pseudomonadota bacterium]
YALNYSSDIDFIILYQRGLIDQKISNQDIIRTCKMMINLIENQTIHGYMFRTDLRLRPDPASTPIAIEIQSAICYYESIARTWERAAMIKAKPIAGDVALTTQFLKHIQPFIWRKYFDFSAIEEIRELDFNASDQACKQDFSNFNGFDLKYGYGAIRNIEFFAQSLQLVWGGRIRSIRVPQTSIALYTLARNKIIARNHAKKLVSCYRFLRLLEHRVQMLNDQQTHSLPKDEEAIDRFATFCNLKSKAQLYKRLRIASKQILDIVTREHADKNDKSSAHSKSLPILKSNTSLEHAKTIKFQDFNTQWFEHYQFASPQSAINILKGWNNRTYCALHNEKAFYLFKQIMPNLLNIIANSHARDIALEKFDLFLKKLPTGVQLLSTLSSNANVITSLVEMIAASPKLAQQLNNHPERLDMLISPHITRLSLPYLKQSFNDEINHHQAYDQSSPCFLRSPETCDL